MQKNRKDANNGDVSMTWVGFSSTFSNKLPAGDEERFEKPRVILSSVSSGVYKY